MPDETGGAPPPPTVRVTRGPEEWTTEEEDRPSGEISPMEPPPPGFRAGFIAVVGRPNVGKSTLINQLVGQKISIVSDKPQTTRTRLLGILNEDGIQIVFVDTPGIHEPSHRLGEFMVESARQSLVDADLIALLVDLSVMPREEDRIAAATVFANAKAPVMLVGNKIDILRNTEPGNALLRYAGLHESGDSTVPDPIDSLESVAAESTAPAAGRTPNGFAESIAVSAAGGDNLDYLLDRFIERMPLSPPFYPPDEVTDQPERAVAAELIREAVLRHTHQEIPHAVAVVVEEFRERENGIIDITATLYVERETQKGIVIGKGGAKLKEIGRDSRAEIEAMMGTKVFLQLWVKVRDQWRKKDPSLRQLGYSLPGHGK